MTRRTKQTRALLDQIKMIDARIANHQVRMEQIQTVIDELRSLRHQLATALQEAERAKGKE